MLVQDALVCPLLQQSPCVQQYFPGCGFFVDLPNLAGDATGVAAGVPFAQAAASTNFLLVAVRVPTVAVRARFAAISCWRTTALFVAARVRLSGAVSNLPIVGASQNQKRLVLN